jgi:hypothetical protein
MCPATTQKAIAGIAGTLALAAIIAVIVIAAAAAAATVVYVGLTIITQLINVNSSMNSNH